MTTRAVYLIGAPATGKSSLMAALLDRLGYVTVPEERYMPCPVQNKEFRVEPLEDIITGARVGVSLGVTRPGGFPGTDGLGMACSPDAVRWVTEHELPPLILGEGQRLGTPAFLIPLARAAELVVVHLTAPDAELDARCAARGSAQSEQFRRASASRARNAAAAVERDGGAEVLHVDSSEISPVDLARQIVG